MYLVLSNDQIAFQADPDGRHRGELRLEVEVTSEKEGRVFERTETLIPQAVTDRDALDRSIRQVMRQSMLLTPGTYLLAVELTDLKSEKPGIIHMIRKTKKKGAVEAMIQVNDFSGPAMRVSDPVLSRGIEPTSDDAALSRNGLAYDPNPSRQFGFIVPFLSYYSEVYVGASFQEGDSVLVQSQVLDAAGTPLLEKTFFTRPRSGAFVAHDQIDLNSAVVPGTHVLRITAKNRRTEEIASVSRNFEVLWAVESWGKDPEALLAEMRLIMRDSEYKKFEDLSQGAREVYLAEYWHKLDPNPVTPENEAMLEFQRRVRFADREFAHTLGRGIYSDRGRVYVRYGPPDDVAYQYSSSSFGNDENVERVTDPSERVEMSNRPGASFLDPDEYREGDVSDLATQRGGTNIKSKEIEVWSYDGPGRPLAGRSSSDRSNRSLKFIFADEMGNGEYELVGSEGTSDF
jgi:GWxTD domain-containing protein